MENAPTMMDPQAAVTNNTMVDEHHDNSTNLFARTTSTRSPPSIDIGFHDGSATPPRQPNFAEEGTPIAGTNERIRQSRFLNGFENHHNHNHEDLAGLVVQTKGMDELQPRPSSMDNHNIPVSNDCMMMQSMMSDLKGHLDKTLMGFQDQTRKDYDKVYAVLQQESTKRTAMEQHLHSQLLLQSEAMVAMELKLLRLEALVERREGATDFVVQQRTSPQQQRGPVNVRSPPPPAPTPEIRQQRSQRMMRSPPNLSNTTNNNINATETMATVMSGTSVASAVTTGSFTDGEDREDGESQQSTPTQGSISRPRVRIAVGNLDAILRDPTLGESAATVSDSVRAIREDMSTDGNSSFGTALTQSTHASRHLLPITGGNLDAMLHQPTMIEGGDVNSMAESVRATRDPDGSNSTVATAVTATTYQSTSSRSILPITGGTIGSILRDPALGEPSVIGESVRATRADSSDGNSTLGTNLTVPTHASLRPVAPIAGGNLESILIHPTLGESSMTRESQRATRGDADDNSSLGTSVTNSTMTSTIATSTLRPESSSFSRAGRQLSEESSDYRRVATVMEHEPRSRSNSPLTVQSYTVASDAPSVTSASQAAATILSSAAVAAPRISRRSLRGIGGGDVNVDSRPLANRVVSFSSDLLHSQPANLAENNCDSITMPDELDNLSEVADIFASSARAWRDEYEARLDALHKRWANE